jgi:uncharacterized protein YqgV (UPF0045/DUF77 family)
MTGATNNIEKARRDLVAMETSIKGTLEESFELISSNSRARKRNVRFAVV